MARTARTTEIAAAAWFFRQSFHSFLTAPTTGAILDTLLADSRPTEAYELPSGEIVDIYADVSRGQAAISYTLHGGAVVTARKLDAADDHRAEDTRGSSPSATRSSRPSGAPSARATPADRRAASAGGARNAQHQRRLSVDLSQGLRPQGQDPDRHDRPRRVSTGARRPHRHASRRSRSSISPARAKACS